MQWSDIKFDPSRKLLREFGLLCLAFFGAIGLYQGLYRGHSTAGLILGAVALAGGLLGVLAPSWLRPIYVAWMVAAFPIGWTISLVVMAAMFYGLFTPIGLFFRLIGRDSMERKLRPAAATYWEPKATPRDPRRYFKQF
jgi:hypothetical protein